MNTNKHELRNKVVVSILEYTTQKSLHMLNTELLKISENALSCVSCLSWLKNIPSVFSVYSVVKNGGLS